MRTVAIVGASGGIGAALTAALAARDDIETVHATYNSSPVDSGAGNDGSVDSDSGSSATTDVRWSQLDASDEDSVRAWLDTVDKVDWLINCVGMLHDKQHGPEKSISALEPEHFAKSMSVNCLPTLLLAKHAHAVLKKSEQGVFATISARVGSISDNGLGGWYSYRASKAALNMSLKCLSIEWARNAKNIRVAALHPGTTDSELSKPFQKNVPEGKLFSAEKTAGLLIEQIEQLHTGPSGVFIAYDGEEIPW